MKPQPNYDSVDAFPIEGRGYEALMKDNGPGAFYFEDDYTTIYIHLPGDNYCALPLDGTEDHNWTWDGNKEKPTIRPSILTYMTWGPDRQRVDLWHGFMTNGRLESC